MARQVRSRWIGQIQVTMARQVLALPSSTAPPGRSWRGVPGPTGAEGNSRRHARDALAAAQPSCWWSPARLVGPGGGGGRSAQPVRQRPATPPLHNVGSLPQPPACGQQRDLVGLDLLAGPLGDVQSALWRDLLKGIGPPAAVIVRDRPRVGLLAGRRAAAGG